MSEYTTNGDESEEVSELMVSPDDQGERLDTFVAENLYELSRSQVHRLIESKNILVNGASAKPGYKIRAGDHISVEIPPPQPTDIKPENIPLDIVYEDDQLIVINKPKGMVVHPAAGNWSGTLVNAVLYHAQGQLSGIGGVERPGIVHRLDKDTSGLIVVARTDFAHKSLARQIHDRTAVRKYLALVWGNPDFVRAVVDAPVWRHPVERQRMAVVEIEGEGREAITELTVKERYNGIISLLEARLQTGRTHQIRVHCAYIGYPVVGDPVYGKKISYNLKDPNLLNLISRLCGQALHAYYLSFDHPLTGQQMEFTVPMPSDMAGVVEYLRERYLR